MKFSSALTSLILLVPLFAGEALGASPYRRSQNNNKNGNGGNNNGGNKNNNNNAVSSVAVSSAAAVNSAAVSSAAAANSAASTSTAAHSASASAAAANSTAGNAAAAAANSTAANNNNGDPQTSLSVYFSVSLSDGPGSDFFFSPLSQRSALDPAVIAQGFANNGQSPPVAGQIASLTSTNNFINFCLTVPNLPITNGQQIKTGSCNPAPMGIIAATTNMPSAKFVSPVNGQNIQANTAFTISMAVNNLDTGNFVNAETNYYAAPQQVNAQGTIIGHTHFTVSDVGSFTSTTPQDPNVFAFFKGVNGAAVNGVVSETVANGLPDGVYRVCSINTDANHMPCLVAVAQHGTLDDCVYVSSFLSICLISSDSLHSSPSAMLVVIIPSAMVQLRLMELMPETQETRETAPEAQPPRLLPLQRRVHRLLLLRRRAHRLLYRLLLLRRRAQRQLQVTAGTRTTGMVRTGTAGMATTETGMATTGTGMGTGTETRASSGVTSDLGSPPS
jgi:hypothetical protein